MQIERQKLNAIAVLTIGSAQVVRQTGTEQVKGVTVPTYSESDFIIKLLVTADETGKGSLPKDLSVFMNGPKGSAEFAKFMIEKLQSLGLISVQIDVYGNYTNYYLHLS